MRRVFLVTAVLVSLLTAASAPAAVPQKSYGCYGEAGTYISTLKIKSASKYSYLGEGGKYEFKSGPKVLHFKSGALKPWVGKLVKSDGDPAIELTTDKAGGQIVNCYS
jgi:hypothetical protein